MGVFTGYLTPQISYVTTTCFRPKIQLVLPCQLWKASVYMCIVGIYTP